MALDNLRTVSNATTFSANNAACPTAPLPILSRPKEAILLKEDFEEDLREATEHLLANLLSVTTLDVLTLVVDLECCNESPIMKNFKRVQNSSKLQQ